MWLSTAPGLLGKTSPINQHSHTQVIHREGSLHDRSEQSVRRKVPVPAGICRWRGRCQSQARWLQGWQVCGGAEVPWAPSMTCGAATPDYCMVKALIAHKGWRSHRMAVWMDDGSKCPVWGILSPILKLFPLHLITSVLT